MTSFYLEKDDLVTQFKHWFYTVFLKNVKIKEKKMKVKLISSNRNTAKSRVDE